MFSLFFGPRSKRHEYITKYNGIKFKTRLLQFFRKKDFKEGQVVVWGKESIKLTKFLRYNNVFSECWEFEFVQYPELGKQQHWF